MVAEMCAAGLDLPINTFTEMLYRGPYIFVPTGRHERDIA